MPGDSLTILHLSDPQFGKNHVFGKRALPLEERKHDTLLERTWEDLLRLKDHWGLQPDLIVMTGDLAEWGMKNEFSQAFGFLAGLAEKLGITPEQRHRIAVIPGNHDINRSLAEAELATWRANDREGEPFGFQRWKFYADAFAEFYQTVPETPLQIPGFDQPFVLRPSFTEKQPHSLFVVPEMKVVLAGLNSTMRECHLDSKQAKKLIGKDTLYGHHGWCGEGQYKHFAATLSPFESQGWLRVGLVHHNVVRGATDDDENLLDSPELRERLGQVLNLLLHGHTHVADRSLLPGGQPILSTGSNALSQAQRPNETPNQYQILRIAANGITAWLRAFEHHSRRWIPDARVGGEDTPGRLWVPHEFRKASSSVTARHEPFDLANKVAIKNPEADASEDTKSRAESRSYIEHSELILSNFEQITRLRWPGCISDWHQTEPPFLNVITNDENGHRSFPVGLIREGYIFSLNGPLERYISPSTIDDFAHQTSMYSWERWLVCEGADLILPQTWKLLQDHASSLGIRLLTWRDYERMCDLRVAIDTQKQNLENSKTYPPDLYVPQGIEFFPTPVHGQSMNTLSPDQESEDALTELASMIRSGKDAFYLIDGDFGAGKTFLLRKLALEFSKDGSPVIPLLIELRSLDKVQNAQDMLITRLNHLGQQTIQLEQLRYMARAGLLLILFDGYDELALRVSFDRASDHLSTIVQAAEGRAIVVLTCRTQHFRDDHQMVLKLLAQPGFRRARLQPFTEVQIALFLEKKLGDAEAAAARLRLIHDIKDLLGLSENPRMLSFIADLPEADLRTAQEAAPDAKITAATLYETLIQRWLMNEVSRRSHKQAKDAAENRGAKPDNRSDERYLEELWQSITRLAFRAWGRIERPFSLEEIEQELATIPREFLDVTLTPSEQLQGIASGSLLSREGTCFAFAHYSLPEYLVTRELARQHKNDPEQLPVSPDIQAYDLLFQETLSDLMAEFLIDQLGQEGCLQFMEPIVRPPMGQRTSALIKNGHRLYEANKQRFLKASVLLSPEAQEQLAAQIEATQATDLRATDQRGQNLAGRDFRSALLDRADFSQSSLEAADLRGASLRGALLKQANLRQADLRGTALVGADLSEADLTQADLRGADLKDANLTRATLIGADLRGAVLTGSQWALARLAGATLDDPQLSGLSTEGAGLPEQVPAFVLGSSASIVLSLAWSPRHGLLVTGHDDGKLSLWDTHSGQELFQFTGHTGSVVSVAVSPDGGLLLSGSEDRTMRLWDVSSGQELRRFTGHKAAVRSVAFSPSGSRLVSGSDDLSLRLWDVYSGQELRQFIGHTDSLRSVAFSPDGNLLASGSDDCSLRLWNPFNGQELRQFNGYTDNVRSVAFSPDGSLLASGSEDSSLRLWDTHSGKELRQFAGHTDWVMSVAFSPDGSHLASGSDDGILRLWDADSGRELRQFAGHTDWVRSVAFSPDGSLLASGSEDSSLRLWDVNSGQELRRFIGHAYRALSVAFSPDGSRLASGYDNSGLRLWDAHNGKELHQFAGHADRVWSVAFSPDGSCLASGSSDSSLRLWDAQSGQELRQFTGHKDSVMSVAFSPDSSRLVSGSSDRSLRLWDAQSGQELRQFTGHTANVWSVAFSPDGSRLASGSSDSSLRLWDTQSGQELRQFTGHKDSVMSVAFSPDGSRLASGSDDRSLRLWDVPSGRELRQFTGHKDGVMSVAFSPDGSRLASGSDDHSLRLWDVPSGQKLRQFTGHTGSVGSVAFWQAGVGAPLLLISSSDDGTVRIWDADTGVCLVILIAHEGGWAALRPDGRYRAVGDMSKHLWHVSGLVRYELGELDEVFPHLKLTENEPLIPPAYFAGTGKA
jgi:WD40 repeat protein/3',5'-cyclic AMP phosphodiesterase CpdA